MFRFDFSKLSDERVQEMVSFVEELSDCLVWDSNDAKTVSGLLLQIGSQIRGERNDRVHFKYENKRIKKSRGEATVAKIHSRKKPVHHVPSVKRRLK